MRVKLEMVFDIPEKYYKDDEEDKGIAPEDLENHWKGFAVQAIFSEFTNYAHCKHLSDALECLSAGETERKDDHKQWAKIINQAQRTIQFTVVKHTPLDTKILEKLAERVARLCKSFNDPEGIAMGKDWTWAELTHEALPELENYLTKTS